MNDFAYYAPTKFVFKRGGVDSVGAELREMGFRNVILVYGQGSVVRNGVLGRVKLSLEAAGVVCACVSGVRPNPEVSLVRAGIELGRAKGIDAVLALGGGSCIDCAKAIACGVPYEGDIWDLFEKKATPAQVGPLPVACVLTLPAAGSEASDSCVISNDELGMKCGINGDCIRPVLAVMDPELTFSLPAYQTAAGATDMIAHICERWFSGVGAVPVTDRTAAGLIRTIMEMAPRAIACPDDYEARANLMWAGTLAHNGMAGLGRGLAYGVRAGGWESHGLEHELSAFDPAVTHGAGLAVILPAWMRYVWKADPQRFLDFARLVFDMNPPEGAGEEKYVLAAIQKLQDFFASIGMPTTMGDLGFVPQNVEALVASLERVKGSEFGAFKRLTMEDARAIYMSAF